MGKRVFADVMKLMILSHPCLGWALALMTRVFVRRKGWSRLELRKDGHVKTVADADQNHKAPNEEMPRNRSWKRQRKKELGPVDILVLVFFFYPHYYGMRVFYCFKPLDL